MSYISYKDSNLINAFKVAMPSLRGMASLLVASSLRSHSTTSISYLRLPACSAEEKPLAGIEVGARAAINQEFGILNIFCYIYIV